MLDMNVDGEEANDDSETEDVVIEMDRNQNEDDEIEDEPNTSEVMDEDGNETDDDVDESDEQNDNDSDIDVEYGLFNNYVTWHMNGPAYFQSHPKYIMLFNALFHISLVSNFCCFLRGTF